MVVDVQFPGMYGMYCDICYTFLECMVVYVQFRGMYSDTCYTFLDCMVVYVQFSRLFIGVCTVS